MICGMNDSSAVHFDSDGLEESPHLASLPLERYDLRILRGLRRIMRAVDIYSRKLAQDHGVTVPQLLCLIKLDELGALALKDLAAEVYLSPSTLVGIVDRLEQRGWLMRERSVRDRRKVRLSLTEDGRELVSRMPSPLQDTLSDSIEKLPELERATIALSLEKILLLMEPHAQGLVQEEVAPILETRPDLADRE